MFDEKYIELNNSFIINYELLLKWLDIKSKKTFVETINNSYKKNIDYIIKKNNIIKHGGSNKKIYILTSDAAKRYCLMTKSKKGDDIRHYFIEIEKALFKYQHYIIKGLEDKINKLEGNSRTTCMSSIEDCQKPKINPEKGVIYVFRALNTDLTLYKIGRTTNLKKRLKSHNSSSANDLEVLIIYEAENIIQLEKCVKILMKKARLQANAQYRKYKEVYQVDLSIIKSAIKDCDSKLVEINNEIMKKNKKGGNAKKLISEDDKIFLYMDTDI